MSSEKTSSNVLNSMISLNPEDVAFATSDPGASDTENHRDQQAWGVASFEGASAWPVVATDNLGVETRDVEGDHRYEMRGRIGLGGMGEVVLGLDRRIGREVAIKRVRERVMSTPTEARFLREAWVQGQLEHPTVVPIYDLAIDAKGKPFFTMKRVRGRTLDVVLRELKTADSDTVRGYSQHKLLSAFSRVCLAVDYAHQRGVIHRDLKPQNIIFGNFGEVHILDWGVARVLGDREWAKIEENEKQPVDARGSSPVTHVGSMLGTPGYMAPEQCTAPSSAIASADVFSLGVMLFEILCHEVLIPATNLHQAISQTVVGDYLDALEQRLEKHNVSWAMRALLSEALRHDPAARMPSARQMAEAIDDVLDAEKDRLRRKHEGQRFLASGRVLRDAFRGGDDSNYLPALKAFGSALVVDPGQEDARKDLGELLLELPATVPSAAQESLRQWNSRTVSPIARTVFLRSIWWVIFLIMSATIPIVRVEAVWIPLLLVSIAFTVSLMAWRLAWTRLRAQLLLASVSLVGLFGLAMVFGPFLALPAMIATTLQMFLPVLPKNYRAPYCALAVAAISAPWVAELLGFWQGPELKFRVIDGALRVYSAIPFGMGLWAILLLSTLGGMIVPALIAVRSQEQRVAAERRVFLQSWYLRQL